MNMRKNKSSFFIYNSLILIVIFLISTSIFYVINNTIFKAKDNEKISIFVECDQVTKNYNEYAYNFSTLMKNNTNVIGVNFYFYDTSNSSSSSYYEKFGKTSDLIILKKDGVDTLKENDLLETNFKQIESSIDSRLNLKNNRYYDKNNEDLYGYLIYEKNNNELNSYFDLINFFNLDTKSDYIMLFGKDSVNFSIEEKEGYSSNAFTAINTLMKLGGREYEI